MLIAFAVQIEYPMTVAEAETLVNTFKDDLALDKLRCAAVPSFLFTAVSLSHR